MRPQPLRQAQRQLGFSCAAGRDPVGVRDVELESPSMLDTSERRLAGGGEHRYRGPAMSLTRSPVTSSEFRLVGSRCSLRSSAFAVALPIGLLSTLTIYLISSKSRCIAENGRLGPGRDGSSKRHRPARREPNGPGHPATPAAASELARGRVKVVLVVEAGPEAGRRAVSGDVEAGVESRRRRRSRPA